MIQKLLDVYNDLMLNVPKVLVKYLPANSDSDSSPDEEEDEDAITVEPSRYLHLVLKSSLSLSLASQQALSSVSLRVCFPIIPELWILQPKCSHGSSRAQIKTG